MAFDYQDALVENKKGKRGVTGTGGRNVQGVLRTHCQQNNQTGRKRKEKRKKKYTVRPNCH